jgi:ribosome biogenesis GTPase / thiamine phosphate phosphatase
MIGLIVKGIAGFYYVKVNDEVIECKARGKFRYDELTPMVGDKVQISVLKGKGVIEKILQRTSELIRPTVANVTQAFVVFSVKSPDLNLDLLYKFLVLCEFNNLRAVICLNKVDLISESDRSSVLNYINSIDYHTVFIQAKEGIGIEELKSSLEDNITVLCGPSGAGKSTLFNELCGNNVMKTGEISEKLRRGKHTTRHSELISINGGYIVDTPGFSSIDINFINKEDLKTCFPEFNMYNNMCRFNGCLHHKEPDCAVKEAVNSGNILLDRYEFYIKSLEEISSRRNKKW